MAPLLLQILYDETGGTKNLIGLIWPVAAYTTRYGTSFVEPTRAGAYGATIDNYSTAVVRECTEAAHKAKRAYCGTYETARRETVQFIFAVVENKWMQELLDTETLYTDVAPKAFLSHIQAGCTGCYALDLMALNNEIQRYHLKLEGIPEYINMLEDA